MCAHAPSPSYFTMFLVVFRKYILLEETKEEKKCAVPSEFFCNFLEFDECYVFDLCVICVCVVFVVCVVCVCLMKAYI